MCFFSPLSVTRGVSDMIYSGWSQVQQVPTLTVQENRILTIKNTKLWHSHDSFTGSIETFLDTYFRVEAHQPGSKAHLIISVTINIIFADILLPLILNMHQFLCH